MIDPRTGGTRVTGGGLAAGAAVLVLLAAAAPAAAARIGDLADAHWLDQAAKILSLGEPAIRYGLLGSLLLGVVCGVMGAYVLVQRLSLMGDVIGHAVLPGICVAFWVRQAKDPLAILVGALLSAMLATATVGVVTRTTRIKRDAAMGLVLSVFFGLGIVLLTRLQKMPWGSQTGLEKFMFGQASALGRDDLWVMGAVAAVIVLVVLLLRKEFLLIAFDPAHARALGFPAGLLHGVLMALVALSIVISLQAVGVVLVAAMMVLPAATAYLLTDRLSRVILMAAGIGALAGAQGTFASALRTNLPTGACMVLSASGWFGLAWLFAPRHGVVTQWARRARRARRVALENVLAASYRLLERAPAGAAGGRALGVAALAAERREPESRVRPLLGEMARRGLVLPSIGESFSLSDAGLRQAADIVRRHRLWELYLVHEAELAPDHVHDDAEEIEHVLGPETVALIEARFAQVGADPHGRRIPAAAGSAPPDAAVTGGLA